MTYHRPTTAPNERNDMTEKTIASIEFPKNKKSKMTRLELLERQGAMAFVLRWHHQTKTGMKQYHIRSYSSRKEGMLLFTKLANQKIESVFNTGETK